MVNHLQPLSSSSLSSSSSSSSSHSANSMSAEQISICITTLKGYSDEITSTIDKLHANLQAIPLSSLKENLASKQNVIAEILASINVLRQSLDSCSKELAEKKASLESFRATVKKSLIERLNAIDTKIKEQQASLSTQITNLSNPMIGLTGQDARMDVLQSNLKAIEAKMSELNRIEAEDNRRSDEIKILSQKEKELRQQLATKLTIYNPENTRYSQLVAELGKRTAAQKSIIAESQVLSVKKTALQASIIALDHLSNPGQANVDKASADCGVHSLETELKKLKVELSGLEAKRLTWENSVAGKYKKLTEGQEVFNKKMKSLISERTQFEKKIAVVQKKIPEATLLVQRYTALCADEAAIVKKHKLPNDVLNSLKVQLDYTNSQLMNLKVELTTVSAELAALAKSIEDQKLKSQESGYAAELTKMEACGELTPAVRQMSYDEQRHVQDIQWMNVRQQALRAGIAALNMLGSVEPVVEAQSKASSSPVSIPEHLLLRRKRKAAVLETDAKETSEKEKKNDSSSSVASSSSSAAASPAVSSSDSEPALRAYSTRSRGYQPRSSKTRKISDTASIAHLPRLRTSVQGPTEPTAAMFVDHPFHNRILSIDDSFSLTKSELEQLVSADRVNLAVGGWTPLLLLARSGKVGLISHFIEKFNPDLTVKAPNGMSLVQLCAYYPAMNNGDLHRLLELLQKREVDFNAPANNSPMLIAAAQGHHYAVDALTDVSANPNLYDDAGYAPIHYAAAVNNSHLTLRHLLLHPILDASALVKSGAHKELTAETIAQIHGYNERMGQIKKAIDNAAFYTNQDVLRKTKKS